MSLRAERWVLVACLPTGCGRTELMLDPCPDCLSVDGHGLSSVDAAGTGGDGGAPSESDAGFAGSSGSEGCSRGQRILLDDVVNARDMGGVPLAGGASVACGTLYRGAPLGGFDDAACVAFSALAIRTVIDLRMESERTGKPDSPCVVTSTDVVVAPLPIPYNVSPTDYIADLNTTDSIAAAFAALGDDAAYPVYFHCTWGRDRTGVLGAVILLTLGAKHEDILTEYELSVEGGVGAYPDSLSAVLDDIDARGGVEAYLAEAGVSQRSIQVLRRRAVVR
ncbi:MAG: tyrosine-protein phosphatase [Polyangiaceae bacterium]|nr:tyrosine-protein phosphatase [Polyangiaceae bacterium]